MGCFVARAQPPFPGAQGPYRYPPSSIGLVDWDWLLRSSDGYLRHEDKATVLDLLGLEPGMIVADVGCGSGFYSFDVARSVGGEGLLFAMDMDGDLLRELEGLALDISLNPHQNVISVENDPRDLGFAEATLDMALLFHLDFPAMAPLQDDKRAFLRSVVSALKPMGRLVAMEYFQGEQSDPQGARPSPSPGLPTERALVVNLEANGLLPVERHELLEYGSVLWIFQKPSTHAPP